MKKIFLVLSLLLTALYAEIPALQNQALQAFYTKTDGPNWTNKTRWFSGDPCINKWYGITCNDANTSVTNVAFGNNNLSGEIPTELQYLPDLEVLVLIDNGLVGNIPNNIGTLVNLKTLMLWGDLNGTIPIELGNFNALEGLIIISKNITGNIPVEIADNSNLTEIIIASNKLEGGIPANIGNLTGLTRLAIGGVDTKNNINGTIPTTFSQLSELQIFTIYNTKITGTIPQWIGNLDYIIDLSLSKNNMTGSIEELIDDLTDNESAIETLDISENKFTGNISSIIILPSIKKLHLNNNLLSGTIPDFTDLTTLNKATGINLNYNNLSTDISQAESDFIDVRSSNYEDWKTTQNLKKNSSPAIIMYLLN